MAQVFHGSHSYTAISARPVLTIGNFDGVHLGHQHLLSRVVARARALDAPACVYTFDPAPRAVLEPERCPPRILDLDQRVALLGRHGIDHVVVEPFDRDFAARPASWFAQEILAERLAPAALVVGHDFRFGRGRAGRTGDLATLLPDLQVEQVDQLLVEGVRPSSSRIREAVAEGRVRDAAEMLGRDYSLRGVVVPGDQRGQQLGFPTANIDTLAELLPASGVYAARVPIDGRPLPAVVNLGVRPTFAGRRFLIEAHLLDFEDDLYGRTLELRFVEFLRPERRFSGPEALVAQIAEDVASAREILGAAPA